MTLIDDTHHEHTMEMRTFIRSFNGGTEEVCFLLGESGAFLPE